MELWIRSQDKKELVKPNDIYLVRENKYFHIYCYVNNSEIDLGQYGDFEDKTRALEVLDEIQEILEPQEYIVWDKRFQTGHSTYNISSYVYEMPEE